MPEPESSLLTVVPIPTALPPHHGSTPGSDPAALVRLAGSLFALADEGVAVCDSQGRICAINPAFSSITGYSPEELTGLPLRHLRSPHHGTDFYRDMLEVALGQGAWRGELWSRRRQGQSFPAWCTFSAVRNDVGVVTHFLVILSDMARRSERHSHLEHMAHHDALTGLPNRMLLLSRLDGALARSRRYQHTGAVLFVDLDHFKQINDNFGHAGGDEVLREVARRVSRRLRASDMAARFGGDEFVVLLEELREVEDAGAVAQGIIELLERPIRLLDGSFCRISASVGIALFQNERVRPEDLVARADEALFSAKHQGRSRLIFYRPDAGGLLTG